ncbi:MAG: A24 family peptidase [Clostridia bacterium]|nr:A24 family peptidase [Clostridia bacterium]
MTIKAAEIVLLMLLSLIWDIRCYKIKNSITLPFAFLGLVTNLYLDGIMGMKISLAGWLTPVALLFILYLARMIGAGDIKLFAAIGAIMGCSFTLWSMAYSFLFGGVIGIFYLILWKNSSQRFGYFLNYVKTCFFTLALNDYSEFQNKEAKDKFRMSYAIVPGTLTQLAITLFGG